VKRYLWKYIHNLVINTAGVCMEECESKLD
jgi:hypothetical protein